MRACALPQLMSRFIEGSAPTPARLCRFMLIGRGVPKSGEKLLRSKLINTEEWACQAERLRVVRPPSHGAALSAATGWSTRLAPILRLCVTAPCLRL